MKLTIIEYGRGSDVPGNVVPLVDRANKVIQRALQSKRDYLVVTDGKLRARGIAGAIRLSKDIELDIVPKILEGQGEQNWREPLFLLAALSRFGDILAGEHIHSNTAYQDSLYDIAGRVLAREYLAHRRKPIRQYRRERFADFSVDGEIDFDRAFERDPDGIPQERVSFDKANPFNSTIQSAMRIVLPYVRSAPVRQMLNRAVEEYGTQFDMGRRRLKVPARNKEWAGAYTLASDIVSGMGSSLEDGEIMSPSFIVDTWRIWEWLVTTALKAGLGSPFQVIPQAAIPWGVKWMHEKSSVVNVFPDVVVHDGDPTRPLFLVDAKYKLLPNGKFIDVDRADLYEAFAFCRAAGAKRLFLAYPAAMDSEMDCGSIIHLTNYEMDDVTISVIKIAFGDVSKRGELTAFFRRFSSEIVEMAGSCLGSEGTGRRLGG